MVSYIKRFNDYMKMTSETTTNKPFTMQTPKSLNWNWFQYYYGKKGLNNEEIQVLFEKRNELRKTKPTSKEREKEYMKQYHQLHKNDEEYKKRRQLNMMTYRKKKLEEKN